MSINFGQAPAPQEACGDSGYVEDSKKKSTSAYRLSQEARKGLMGGRGDDHRISDSLIQQAVKKASNKLKKMGSGEKCIRDYKILGEGCDEHPYILQIVIIKKQDLPIVLTVFRKDFSQHFQEMRVSRAEYEVILKELPSVDATRQ